jgi:hypothetical protein
VTKPILHLPFAGQPVRLRAAVLGPDGKDLPRAPGKWTPDTGVQRSLVPGHCTLESSGIWQGCRENT